MGARFSLVIASEHEAEPDLPMLEGAARRLDVALRDPLRGMCDAALPGGRSLLIGAGREETEQAVFDALQRAHAKRGLLILVWIGHGRSDGADFYVLPQGCDVRPGWPNGPYALVQHLKQLLPGFPGVELTLILDACDSGTGLAQSLEWVKQDNDLRRQFQVFAASNIGQSAFRCEFSTGIATLLERGHIKLKEHIDGSDFKGIVAEQCFQALMTDRQPSWVARNAALFWEAGALLDSPGVQLEPLRNALRFFCPTPNVGRIVAATEEHRYVVVRAPAGYGKTTLMAALTRPELGEGVVPAGFVHGIWLLNLMESADGVAVGLAAQLEVTVPEFTEAQREFERATPQAELQGISRGARYLFGPLRSLPDGVVVRIILDGFDQLSQASAHGMNELMDELCSIGCRTSSGRC
jgi:hypothetical protein